MPSTRSCHVVATACADGDGWLVRIPGASPLRVATLDDLPAALAQHRHGGREVPFRVCVQELLPGTEPSAQHHENSVSGDL